MKLLKAILSVELTRNNLISYEYVREVSLEEAKMYFFYLRVNNKIFIVNPTTISKSRAYRHLQDFTETYGVKV